MSEELEPKEEKEELSEEELTELKASILYKSFFAHENGPFCHCMTSRLDRFHAFLPEDACGKDITDMTFEKEFQSDASTVCPCQEAHCYTIKFGPNGVEFEEVPAELFDKRKLKLPNFRDY